MSACSEYSWLDIEAEFSLLPVRSTIRQGGEGRTVVMLVLPATIWTDRLGGLGHSERS